MRESFTLENTQISPLESVANFEGNHSLLLRERLQNPTIKRKLVDLIFEYQETIDPPKNSFRLDDSGNLVEIPPSDWVREIQTKEQIEKELSERMGKVFSFTKIEYDTTKGSHSGGEGDVGTVSFCSPDLETGSKWTTRQLSIIEAHEKGHGIRSFREPGERFKAKVLSGFNFSKVKISPLLREVWLKIDSDPLTNTNNVDQKIIEYFTQPMEIIERMAQLKNYFGMSADGDFTKEHLNYARNHYCTDTGMSLQIKIFIDAITPETEQRFLELINSLGI